MSRDTKGSRFLLGTLLVAAFTAAAADSRSAPAGGSAPSAFGPARSAAAAVLAPVQSGVDAVSWPLTSAASAIRGARDGDERIAALTAENLELAAELRAIRGDAALSAGQAGIDAAARAVDRAVRPARVIAVSAEGGYSWTVAIDLGSDDGVERDMTVLAAAGLVGRVVSTTATSATVLLLVDPLSSVGVRMADGGEIGTLEGAGDALPRLTLFDRHAGLEPGDEVVTFGSPDDRPFVGGVPVGRVVAVSEGGGAGPVATVRPYAPLGALDVVGVAVPAQPLQARAVPGRGGQ